MNQPADRLGDGFDDQQPLDQLSGFGEPDSTRIDNLTLGPDPAASAGRWHRWVLVAVAVFTSLAALAVVGSQDGRELGVLGSQLTPLNVLVLGDPSAGSEGCAGCFGYVDQLADSWSEGGRRLVHVDDQTLAADAEPAAMPALVEQLRSDPYVRAAVSVTDVIVLAVGSGDVTRPPGSAPCRAKRRSRCRAATAIPEFRDGLTSWMVEADTIRGRRPVMLRVVTPPPTSGLPRQIDVYRSACEIAVARGAACVNVYSLARTNEHLTAAGPDPRHPRLTQRGHDLVAEQIIGIGLH